MSKSYNGWPFLSEGDKVIWGKWPGQKSEIACKVVLSLDCVKRALPEGVQAIAGLLTHTCCTVLVNLHPETLRLAEFILRLLPQWKAAVLGVKGKAGDQ